MGCSCIKIVFIKVSNILRDSLLSSKRTTISFEFKARFDGWCLPFIYFHFLHVLLAHIPCMLGTIQESPVALSRWGLVGLASPKNASSPSKLKYETLWFFIRLLECWAPCTNVKTPTEDSLATVLGITRKCRRPEAPRITGKCFGCYAKSILMRHTPKQHTNNYCSWSPSYRSGK